MRVLGLITEYNPFHNGHLYHLEKSREITGCDTVVCVMSGSFIQRGQPSLVNKWARTEMALTNGVDLVIELPVYYSAASAEFFAYGSIKLLDSLGFVKNVCFGSECGDTGILDLIAKTLLNEPEFFKERLALYLNAGHSFPTCRSLALQDYFAQNNKNDSAFIKAVINQPNNILGIEYMKALRKLNSRIKPRTIKRYKADYNSYVHYGSIASATAIRKMLKNGELDIIKSVVPSSTFDILRRELDEGRGPVFLDSFESILFSTIRKMSTNELKRITDVGEGMENRIKKAGLENGKLSEFLSAVKTKRYTLTRLQRIMINILLGLSNELFDKFNSNGGPQYIRVLGFSEKGKELLSMMKNSALPAVVSPSDFLQTCTPLQREMLNADILASDIYWLGYPAPSQRSGGQDYYKRVITI